MVKNSKRIASILLSLALVFSLMSVSAFASETTVTYTSGWHITDTIDIGDGVEYNFVINNYDDLKTLEAAVEDPNGSGSASEVYVSGVINVLLTDNITISADKNWDGIGVPQSFIAYCGTFNGQGYTITTNLTNSGNYGPKGGIFNLTGNSVDDEGNVTITTIKNLNVVGTVNSNRFIGGIVGRAMGDLDLINCNTYTSSNTLTLELSNGASNSVGGLIGQCGSGVGTPGSGGGASGGTEGIITIDNCSVKGNFTSNSANNPVGGMIGHVYAGYEVIIKNCSKIESGTTLTAPANTPVGAYVANNAGTVTVKSTCTNNTSYSAYGVNTGTFNDETVNP